MRVREREVGFPPSLPQPPLLATSTTGETTKVATGTSSFTNPTSIEDQPFPIRSYESSDGHLRICASTANPAATRNAYNQVSMGFPNQMGLFFGVKRSNHVILVKNLHYALLQFLVCTSGVLYYGEKMWV